MKISVLVENFDFSQNFQKIPILVKIFGKSRCRSKFTKISILGKLLKNLDFGQNFQKISISVEISKISILVEIFKKSRFESKDFIQP